MICVYSGKN